MKKPFTTLLFLSLISILFSQSVTISGYISDDQTSEKLIGTNIINLENGRGVVSNNYGFFSYSTATFPLRLSVSFIGYQTQIISINQAKDTSINVRLLGGKAIDEVVVMENSLDAELRSTQMSLMHLPLKELKQLPVLMGETDVLRTIQLLPGVHTGGEGTAALYVRGGGPDQNLILLDGIPIYNAYHLFGFFSVFNTDAIKNITLYKGGFPAEYGGRVSSVLDIRMKEGNMRDVKGNVSIGLIASSVMVEGPIIADKTSFILSARRTFIDVLARPMIKNLADGATTGYYFYDLTGKINHKFSDKSRLYLSTYVGKDAFYSKNDKDIESKNIQSEHGMNWANYTAAARWNYIFGSRLFSNTSFSYSNYKYQIASDYKELEGDLYSNYSYLYYSGIQDLTTKTDFEFIQSPLYKLKFGAEHTYHTFRPGVSTQKQSANTGTVPVIDSVYGNQNIYANEMALYVDNTLQFGEHFSTNFGLRFSGFNVQNTWYQNLEPRASINYMVNSNLSLKASFAVMNQYVHLLTNTTSSMPTDLWLPVTAKVKPQHALQYALGSVYKINKQMNISVEGFYKSMFNLIEYSEGSSFYSGFTEWEQMVETGKGWSYGLELLLKKQFGKSTGWIGYTWSKTERQFENLNFGNPFPYKYDRRHDFSIALTHKLNKNIDVSATWVYGTGNAYTMPYSQIPSVFSATNNLFSRSNFYSLYHFEERNAKRMPANHRLDLGINFNKEKKRGIRTWSLGLYNAYNRKNAFYLTYDSHTQQMVATSIFPILPFVKYQFAFN